MKKSVTRLGAVIMLAVIISAVMCVLPITTIHCGGPEPATIVVRGFNLMNFSCWGIVPILAALITPVIALGSQSYGAKEAELIFLFMANAVSRNAADFADKPSKKKTEATYYDVNELNKLIDVVEGTSIEVPVMLALHWGLRRSEVLGLKWSNIDLDKRTVNICSKVVRVYNDKGQMVAKCDDETMKTASSRRTLPITDSLYEYLIHIKRNQEEYRYLFGNCYNTEHLDFVCVDKTGKRLDPDYVSSKFRNILLDNGLKPMNFHGLRHSCATLLLSLDFDIRYIQEYLGHSSYQITAQTYAHVNFENKKAMGDKISDALK